MAITASGIFGLTFEKQLIDTAGVSMESETLVKGALITDSATPAFDTHDFFNDLEANEVSGTGYSAGGVALTTTEITVGSPAAGQTKFDHDDPSWSGSTITGAMALVEYLEVGASSADMLLLLLDFVTAVNTVSGLLTVQIAANGAAYWDLTP